MPRWGLTPEQRNTRPWGLAPGLLEPEKIITDPVHGDIYLTKLEMLVLDSRPMQRLRRVRQLSATHLVYPGATHSRFSHALGALRSAQDLMDAVAEHRNRKDPKEDRFSEWEHEDADRAGLGQSARGEWLGIKIAEATVLARLGALLHDFGHVPFGHAVEDELKIFPAHDADAARFTQLWSDMLASLEQPVEQLALDADLAIALRPLILSKEKTNHGQQRPDAATRYPFVEDIVGNTICADLVDYLARDHLFTGLPMRLGKRFLEGFYVTAQASNQPDEYCQRMVVEIVKDGRPREDVISELFKYLRYRYELSERALEHHAKLAADAMVGKLLEILLEEKAIALLADELGVSAEMSVEEARGRSNSQENASFQRCQARAKKLLSEMLLRHGDDGFLERLLLQAEVDTTGRTKGIERRFFIAPAATVFSARRRLAIQELAEGLQDRRLYKLVGRSDAKARSAAKALHKEFGRSEARRRLELRAAQFVGIKGWEVILWIPDPRMRLKAANVLIDDGGPIRLLRDYDEYGPGRGKEIYSSHERLWAISVFAPRSVRDSAPLRDALLAWLAIEFHGLEWSGWHQQRTIGSIAAQYCKEELTGLERLELAEVIDRDPIAAFRPEDQGQEGFETWPQIQARTHEEALTIVAKRRPADTA